MDCSSEERIFELFGQSPLAWLEQADCLRMSAELVLAKFVEIHPLPQVLPGVRVQMLAFMDSYMLLMGLSFENLIKGVHISKTPDLSTEQRMKKWGKHRGGHGISTLIKVVDSVTSEEESILKRLEEYVLWAGRYPIPVKVDQYCRSIKPENRLFFTTRDPVLCDKLFKRLSAMIGTTTQ